MSLPIVGAHFRPPAKAVLNCLAAGVALRAVPEPTNEHDPNAIKVVLVNPAEAFPEDARPNLELQLSGFGFTLPDVLDAEEVHLGYIPRNIAEILAPKMGGESQDGTLVFDAAGKPKISLPIAEDLA